MKSEVRNKLSVTTPEQSRQMLAVGYSIETADMVWIKPHYHVSSILQEKEKAKDYPPDSYDILPAWSLLRLYQMFPSCLSVTTNEYTGECFSWDLRIDKYMGITYVDNDGKYVYVGNADSLTPMGNLVGTFIWLAQNNWMFAVNEELNYVPEEMR